MNHYKLVTITGKLIGDGIGLYFSIGQVIRFIGALGTDWKVVAITTVIDTHFPYNTESQVTVEEI